MLLLLGQMSEQARRARENRDGLHGGGREAQVEHHGRDRHRDVHRERLVPGLGHAIAEAAREQDVGPADLAGIRQLENPFGAGVERPMNRVAEPGQLVAGSMDLACHLIGDRRGSATGRHPFLRRFEQPRARLGSAEDHRAAAQDPRRDGPVQRFGVGRKRHARSDVGGHHPVLGDRDEQQVEEEALVLGRLAAGQQQVEVLGEAQPAHQVAAEVASPDLDPVRIGLADVADRGPGLTDLHTASGLWPASGRRYASDARLSRAERRAAGPGSCATARNPRTNSSRYCG